jgi:hypothetical protein
MPGRRRPIKPRPARSVTEWLVETDQPSVRYFALRDLLDESDSAPVVRAARSRIPRVGWAAEILRQQKPEGFWEPRPPRGVRGWLQFLQFPQYRSTLLYALALSDLGMTSADRRIRRAAEQIFDYKLRLSSPVNFFTEEVCAVGNTARTLTRFGYLEDRRVQKLFAWLLEDQRDNGGWNCAPDRPGTLDGWEALAAFASVPPSKRSARMDRAIERGVEFYLDRRLFHEGSRYEPWFRFHYPNHYFYDILVGLDFVTALGYADDPRLRPALDILEKKRRRDGTWQLDRVHPDVGRGVERDDPKSIRTWTFEPPGRPSKWITLTALRVLKRVGDAA